MQQPPVTVRRRGLLLGSLWWARPVSTRTAVAGRFGDRWRWLAGLGAADLVGAMIWSGRMESRRHFASDGPHRRAITSPTAGQVCLSMTQPGAPR